LKTVRSSCPKHTKRWDSLSKSGRALNRTLHHSPRKRKSSLFGGRLSLQEKIKSFVQFNKKRPMVKREYTATERVKLDQES